jgi:hypothetical protein
MAHPHRSGPVHLDGAASSFPGSCRSGQHGAPTVVVTVGAPWSRSVVFGDQRVVPVRWVPVKVRLSAAVLPWKVLSAVPGSEIANVR